MSIRGVKNPMPAKGKKAPAGVFHAGSSGSKPHTELLKYAKGEHGSKKEGMLNDRGNRSKKPDLVNSSVNRDKHPELVKHAKK